MFYSYIKIRKIKFINYINNLFPSNVGEKYVRMLLFETKNTEIRTFKVGIKDRMPEDGIIMLYFQSL